MSAERDSAIRRSEAPEFVALLYDVPEAWIPDMEERAAVLQYDGGLSRAEAERRVAGLVRAKMEAA